MSQVAKKHVKQETRSRAEVLEEMNAKIRKHNKKREFPHPEVLVPNCLDTVLRISPTGSDSKRLKSHNINLQDLSTQESLQVSSFCRSVDTLDSSILILKHIESGALKLIQPKNSSRYFEQGRKRIKKRLLQKIGGDIKRGVMVTLTYDPVKVKRGDAWRDVGSHISKFLDWANKYRKRKMKDKKRVTYFWVIEEQEGTGYPHVHIFFPSLNWFVPFKALKSYWGKYGSVDIKSYKTVNVAKYISKYIGKMRGYSLLALSYLWVNRRRMYSFSKSLADNTGVGSAKEKIYEIWGVYNKKRGYGEWSDKKGGFNWIGEVPLDEVMDLSDGVEESSIGIFELLVEGLSFTDDRVVSDVRRVNIYKSSNQMVA